MDRVVGCGKNVIGQIRTAEGVEVTVFDEGGKRERLYPFVSLFAGTTKMEGVVRHLRFTDEQIVRHYW